MGLRDSKDKINTYNVLSCINIFYHPIDPVIPSKNSSSSLIIGCPLIAIGPFVVLLSLYLSIPVNLRFTGIFLAAARLRAMGPCDQRIRDSREGQPPMGSSKI